MAVSTSFLQATFNYERQQGIGWAWALEPALRRFYPDAALRRGRDGSLGAAQRAAVVFAFAVGLSYAAACLVLGLRLLGPLLAQESLRLSRAWMLAQPLWIGLGLAQLLHTFLQRRLERAAVFGFALVAAWLVLIVGGR